MGFLPGNRMFWGAQLGATGNVATVSALPHLTLDIVAAGVASGLICSLGIGYLWKHRNLTRGRTGRLALLGVEVHEDHMFWSSQAAGWALLAAVSHAAIPPLAAYSLLSVTVASLLVAMLNKSPEMDLVEELSRIHALEAKLAASLSAEKAEAATKHRGQGIES